MEKFEPILSVFLVSPPLLVALAEIMIVFLLIYELKNFRTLAVGDLNRPFHVFNSLILVLLAGVLFSLPSLIEKQVNELNIHIVPYPSVVAGTSDALLFGNPENWVLYTYDTADTVLRFYEQLTESTEWRIASQQRGETQTLLMESPGKQIFIVLVPGRGQLTEIHYALSGIVRVTTSTSTVAVE